MTVRRRDPGAIHAALRQVLTDPALAATMADRAEREAPALLWGSVAQQYRELATSLVAAPGGEPVVAGLATAS